MAKIKKNPRAGFANRLTSLRKSSGMSQAELGRVARMPAMTVSHYECGRRSPSVPNLQRLAVALKVSTDDLLR